MCGFFVLVCVCLVSVSGRTIALVCASNEVFTVSLVDIFKGFQYQFGGVFFQIFLLNMVNLGCLCLLLMSVGDPVVPLLAIQTFL